MLYDNTDEAWRVTGEILCAALGVSVDAKLSLAKARELWELRKEGLRKLLGGDRLVVPLDKARVPDNEVVSRVYRVAQSINSELLSPSVWNFLLSLSPDEVVSNTVKSPKEGVVSRKEVGIKVSKVLGRLIDNSYAREYALNEWSRLLVDVRVFKNATKLVLSINPFDIIAMSLAKHWTSCHNVASGAYCAGAYAYLIDEHTMIAQVVSGTTEIDIGGWEFLIPHKIWRMCIYADPDAGVASLQKHYPTAMGVAHNKVCEILGELMARYKGADGWWNEDGYTLGVSKGLAYVDSDGVDIIRVHGASLRRMEVGGHPPCPVCGRSITKSSALLCERCKRFKDMYGPGFFRRIGSCSVCGALSYAAHTVGEHKVCDDCYRKGAGLQVCPDCGEIFFASDGHICAEPNNRMIGGIDFAFPA